MRGISDQKFLLTASFLFFVFPSSLAELPGKDLLALVPTGAQIVAGINVNSSSLHSQPHYFTLGTNLNSLDLNDLCALVGVDSEYVIRQIIFVAAPDKAGSLSEHSLLVSGHFDRTRIYGSAVDGGATITDYHGISVLEVLPFAREREEFNDVRWLVAPDSDLLLFGSMATVQQELDRFRNHRAVDPLLVRRLARMHHDVATWSLFFVQMDDGLSTILATLNPQLAYLVRKGDSFRLAIRYARQVEIEFEVTTASGAATRDIADSFAQSLAGPAREAALLSVTDMTEDDKNVHGVVKVPIARYKAWLAEVSARTRARRSSTQ
jgi:hypothetical protein